MQFFSPDQLRVKFRDLFLFSEHDQLFVDIPRIGQLVHFLMKAEQNNKTDL